MKKKLKNNMSKLIKKAKQKAPKQSKRYYAKNLTK